MKKTFTLIFLLILICAVFTVFSACDSGESINKYEYSASSFFDADSRFYNSRATATANAEYHFAGGSTDEKDGFVTYAEKIYKYLEEDKQLEIYVASGMKTAVNSSKSTIYINTYNPKSIQFVNCFFQIKYGESANYGLTYGLSYNVFKKLKLGGAPALKSDEQIKTFLSEEKNRYVLDLTYGVFDGMYSSIENIEFAKSISVKVVDFIQNKYGDNAIDSLLTCAGNFDKTFDGLFYGYLNEWLQANECGSWQECAEPLRATAYSVMNPVKISTVSCDYFVQYDWKEIYIEQYYLQLDTDFEYNYFWLTRSLIDYEPSYKKVREFFDDEEEERIPVYFNNNYYPVYTGMLVNKGLVQYTVLNMLRGYTYALLVRKNMYNSWMCTALIVCLSSKYDPFLNMYDIVVSVALEEFADKSSLTADEVMEKAGYEKYLAEFLGENSQMKLLHSTNYVRLIDFGQKLNHNQTNWDTGYYYYVYGLSAYLIDTYGKDRFLSCYGTDLNLLYNEYGKDADELFEEYKTYLLDLINR